MRNIFILLSGFMLLISCSRESDNFVYLPQDLELNTPQLEKIENSDESYYIYTPLDYDADETYPLIMCLSPSSDGKTPVELLSLAAESFGVIVVGSNDVRNNYEGNLPAVKNLIQDVSTKYAIEPNEMFGCGFSGGARLATVLGDQGVFKGVISCSASPGQSQFLTPVPYYAIVGKADFNYNELVAYQPPASMTGNYMMTYHTQGHEWPDATSLYHAVAYLILKSQEYAEPDEQIATGYQENLNERISQLETEQRMYDAVQLIDYHIKTMGNILDVESLKFRLQQLAQNPALKMELARKKELAQLDQQLMEMYAGAMMQMDTTWWKDEMYKLDMRIIKADGETRYTLQRTKASLGIMAFMYGKRFIDDKRPETARLLDVYQILEPENPDVFYLKALYAKTQKKPQLADKLIKKAVSMGLSDTEHKLEEFKTK